MSIADILQAAIERCRKVSDKQAEEANAAQQRFAENLGKPWKFKAESLREALTHTEKPNDSGT